MTPENTAAEESRSADLKSLRRPLHLLLWGAIIDTVNFGPPAIDQTLNLSAAALIGFAAIGMLQATRNRIARAGFTFVACVELFEAISVLLPPSQHPAIWLIRVAPALFAPVVISHAMLAISDQRDWDGPRRSWTLTFRLMAVLSLGGLAISGYAALVRHHQIGGLNPPQSPLSWVITSLLVGFAIITFIQFLTSIIRTLQRIRDDLDEGTMAGARLEGTLE